MGYLGKLQKMEITAYEKGDFATVSKKFSVYINPDKYTHSQTYSYAQLCAPGSQKLAPAFNKITTDEVTFNLVFDGTGVIAGPLPGVVPFTDDGIKDQIKTFKDVVFQYDGTIHSPRFLELSWGTLLFKCRLTSLNITYTLFKPDGTPLRATAKATFVSYLQPGEAAKEANKTSPDLSHLVTVKAGDTLPLLCYRIYGSSVYYRQVAEINGLTDFRSLSTGAQLLFPPLRGASK